MCIFHNHNPSNLDYSDQQIRLLCDLNLNPDYESVDLPLKVDMLFSYFFHSNNMVSNLCIYPQMSNSYFVNFQ